MKKLGILNGEISRVLGYMGHTDSICVADCGLPVHEAVERIDISLAKGVPSFIQTVSVIAQDMVVEKITLALEIKEKNPEVLEHLRKIFPGVQTEFVPHDRFKTLTNDCRAVVRTGEATPYANVILHSGVNF